MSFGVLDGCRTLLCFWIILFHIHTLIGVYSFPSWSLNYIYDRPILGWLVNSPCAVNAYWMISGFLCEYQLNTHCNINKKYWYIFYLIHRILRLYCLVLIIYFLNYIAPDYTECSSIYDVSRAIFTLDLFYAKQIV